MPGDIPYSKIKEVVTLLKRSDANFNIDKIDEDAAKILNKVLAAIGAAIFPEDKSTTWLEVQRRLAAANINSIAPANEMANANDPANAVFINATTIKSMIRRTAGKKVEISTDTLQRTNILIYNVMKIILHNAAAATHKRDKAIMLAIDIVTSIEDAQNPNHDLQAILAGSKIKASKSKSKSKRVPPNCNKREREVKSYIRKDGKMVAASCRRKSRKSKSRKSSKKSCSKGKTYRKGYKSASGKRVPGKCVKKARKSKSRSHSSSRSRSRSSTRK